MPPSTSDNTVQQTTEVKDKGLEVSISSNQDVIGIDPELTYTLKITNNNKQGASATGLTTEVILPEGVSFVRAGIQPSSGSELPDGTGQTRLKFTIPNALAASQNFSTQIITKVTGFSQPLDKLTDYLWNIGVKGSALGNISGTTVISNIASKSTQVDSSIGAAELIKTKLLNSVKDSAESGLKKFRTQGEAFINNIETINDSIKTQFKELTNFKELAKQITDPNKPGDLLKLLPSVVGKSVESGKLKTETDLTQTIAGAISVSENLATAPEEFIIESGKKHLENALIASLDLALPEHFTYKDRVLSYSRNGDVKFNVGVKVGEFSQDAVKGTRLSNLTPFTQEVKQSLQNTKVEVSVNSSNPRGRFGITTTYDNSNKSGKAALGASQWCE